MALVTIADQLGLTPFGVELHAGRAEQARVAIDELLAPAPTGRTHLLHDSYRHLQTTRAGFNLLYLNPPYDHDDEDGRLEYQWLVNTRPWLQPGGLLVWVVPQHLLRFRKATRYILSWYDQIQLYRFPDDSYTQFRQIVLFGVRRPKGVSPDSQRVDRWAATAVGRDSLRPLTMATQPTYLLPPLTVSTAAFQFRSQFVDPADALAEARRVGASVSSAWRDHLDPGQSQIALRPLTPLKIGHMNGIIAAGFLNNQVLAEGGERLLIKGRNYKVTHISQFEEPLPDGRLRRTETETEAVVTDITTVTADGQVQSYQGAELEQFLTRWIGPLTGIVAQDYPPTYTFDLNGYGPVLNRLSQQRPIPGLNGQSGLLPAQKHAAAAVLTRLETADEAIVVGECGSGKAQPMDCKVLTPTGWKRMGDMAIGDTVVNPEGGTARVIGVYPQGKKAIYRVTFRDGAQTECCAEHLWQVLTPERKWRQQPPQVFELQQIRHKLIGQCNQGRYYIPLVKPVEFVEQPLPLDPYLLGALIGDGGLANGSPMFSSADDEVLQEVRAALPRGTILKHRNKYDYCIRGRRSSTNPVTVALRKLNLMGHRSESKFIPKRYLFASVKSRIALLQGLLDTDGTIGKRGHISYSTISEQLAKDVVELVQSLGGIVKLATRIPRYTHNGEKRDGQLAYRLHIRLPNAIQPFRLSRKLARVVPRTRCDLTRAMIEATYVGQKEAQCIALDSENQLYVTDDYIVTHNTTIGAAIAAGRSAQRTIVLCPPHLVAKWQREFKAVWPGVRTTHLQTIRDVDQFFAEQPDNAPLVGVLKQTTARSASGWEHAYDDGGPASHSYGSGGFSDIERLWGKVLTPRQLTGEATASPHPRTEKQIQAMAQRGLRCPVCGATQFHNGRVLTVKEMKSAPRCCSHADCGSPLYQFRRRRSSGQDRGSFRLYVERERQIRRYTSRGQPVPLALQTHWHGSMVADSFGYGKVPLAGYIKHRARGRLDLLLVDEVHQYKGIDSDQGYAMHHLAQAAQKVVALTGTIYGGKASSLFYLLFRLAPALRHAYVDPEASGQRRLRRRDWVAAYGILQRIETTTLDEAGRQTANSRSNIRYKELPGGSPALLPWLLNRSVFLALGDMGFPLPDYREIPVAVPMAPVQANRYEELRAQLKEELKERLLRGDKSLLAGYLYALLFWPDSPRRTKVVRCPRTDKVVASVTGLPNDFIGPKEAAIIERCQLEQAAGRKVLLLCQQTDTLDIQPMWQTMLAEAGLKAAILRAAPNKREKWVAKQVAAGVDVIISHPRKVETGIDLLDFPTIIWMAIDYSVYTVLQASRRSWRIGQTEPVKVYFYAYEETIQTDALQLVAAKVAAALRVNGDTVGDDSLADLDDLTAGDLLATLAKIVVGETQIEGRSLQQAFADANASLRQANTIIGEYRIVDEATKQVVNGRGSNRPVPPHPKSNGQQTTLFGNGRAPVNGTSKADNGATSATKPVAPDKSPRPPIPRPRLLNLSRLSSGR